jgi:hypothetical protein
MTACCPYCDNDFDFPDWCGPDFCPNCKGELEWKCDYYEYEEEDGSPTWDEMYYPMKQGWRNGPV